MKTECNFEIWIALLNLYLKEFNEEASNAKIDCHISTGPTGMQITVDGFENTFPVYFEELLNEIQKFKIDLVKDQFESTLGQKKDQFQNRLRSHVYNILFQKYHLSMLEGSSFDLDLLANEVGNCDF